MSEEAQILGSRHVGGLTFAVVMEENHEDSLTITEHPVEQGAAVNDHAYVKPASLTLRAGVSDVQGQGTSREMYEKLRKLQAERHPFEIVTGKRLYKDMLLESLSTITDANTEQALVVTLTCRQVIIVKTQVVSVPPRARHKKPGKTGGTADKGQKNAQRSSAQALIGEKGKGHTRTGGAAPGYGG